MEIHFPQIGPDAPGPDGRPGFLLLVPRSEAVEWDVRQEIGSTSRHWMKERGAWWVAAPYLHAAEGIVARHAPAPRPGEAPPLPEPAPIPPRRRALAALRAWLRRLRLRRPAPDGRWSRARSP